MGDWLNCERNGVTVLLKAISEKKVVLIPLVLVIFLTGALTFLGRPDSTSSGGASDPSVVKTIMWEELAELDYKNGTASKRLLDASGTRVRIPGFVVPLEDNSRRVTEFLLVPNGQACIHVPPPPPNQMVHIQMESGKFAEAGPFPVWVEGIFNLKEKTHSFGKASFSMTGLIVERYKEKR